MHAAVQCLATVLVRSCVVSKLSDCMCDWCVCAALVCGMCVACVLAVMHYCHHAACTPASCAVAVPCRSCPTPRTPHVSTRHTPPSVSLHAAHVSVLSHYHISIYVRIVHPRGAYMHMMLMCAAMCSMSMRCCWCVLDMHPHRHAPYVHAQSSLPILHIDRCRHLLLSSMSQLILLQTSVPQRTSVCDEQTHGACTAMHAGPTIMYLAYASLTRMPCVVAQV